MFKSEILLQLKQLNIKTITDTLKEAESIHPLKSLPLKVELPYCLCKINSDAAFDMWYSKVPNIGYIAINGIKYIILFAGTKNQKLRDFIILNKDVPNPNGEYELTSIIDLKYSDNINIFHRQKPKKKQEEKPKETTTPAIEPLCGLFADTVEAKPNNLFYFEYAMKHPSFYLYARALNNDMRFKDFKHFKLYCTLLFIAEKSSITKHKRNECYISSKDILAVLPDYFRNQNNNSNAVKNFLELACSTGMLNEYNIENEYYKLTYSDTFMGNLSTPPYTKVPLELVNDITPHNHKFILYFILRNFKNNPKKPYFINIKTKELLKLSEIKIRTLSDAADRLKTYFSILEKYQAVRPFANPDNDNTVTVEDIRNNNLLSFRLYKFQQPKQTDYFNLDDEEPGEESSSSSSDDVFDEPTPPNPKAKKFIPSEAFLKANAEIDAR